MTASKTPSGKWKAKVEIGDRTYHVGIFGTREAALDAIETERGRLRDGTSVLVLGDAALTSADYAKRIGVRYGTIKRWIHEGMPVSRAGMSVRIDPAIVDPWVKANHSASVAFFRAALIYCVQRKGDGAVKIGWTSGLERRLIELRKESLGDEVTLLAAVPGDKPDELKLHAQFAESRIDGEWFRVTPASAIAALLGRAA